MLQRTVLPVLLALVAAQAQTPAADTTAPAAAPSVQAPAPVKPAPAAPALDKPNALHMHPIATGVTLAVNSIPTWWYFTFERELGNGKSITIQPVFVTGEFAPEVFDDEDDNPIEVSQFGVTGAFRFYTNGQESRGNYFAPAIVYSKTTASQEGLEISTPFGSYKEDDVEITATVFGALVYAGYRGKNGAFSWFIDAGLGFQNVTLDASDGTDLDEVAEKVSSGIAYDVNYGIGIAF